MMISTRNRADKCGPPFVNSLGTLEMYRGTLLLVFTANISCNDFYMQYEDRKKRLLKTLILGYYSRKFSPRILSPLLKTRSHSYFDFQALVTWKRRYDPPPETHDS